MSKVVIIGAGAAGMMAAIAAADAGHEVLVLEKNDRPGKKDIYYRQRPVQHHK